MSAIEVPRPDECSFCEYLAGRRRYTILTRDELAATLVTREQRGVAHVLVIPVAHRETVLDLTDDEAAAVMLGVRAAARAVARAESPLGISVWQNNGVAANQSVPHVHVHVAGTLPNGGTKWGPVPRLGLDDTDAIAARLRPFLDG